MAGSLPPSRPRQTLCGVPPEMDTDEVSKLAQTADYEHAAEESVQQFDPGARYQIIERIGAGGFGVVFKAWDSQLERTVAIKVLRPGAGSDPTAALLAEARTLAKLDHPAIVPVYDLGKTAGGELLIVSKFVDGRDLRAAMNTQPLNATRTAQCVATIAEALAYAHAQGIVHRDVKPGNILLTAAGEAVLSDFGLALHEHAVGTGNQLVGTPAYMSPEQARSEGHRVDGRSDIYSLGTVFYELLTGQRPFVSKNREELLDFIRNVEVRPPRQISREIPRELERICLKSLAKRASERYSTAGDMAEELRAFLAAEQGGQGRPLAAASATAALAADETSGTVVAPIVVPHGLRSFDEADADFFLHLVPGARDREGVPESVRFWQRRIEATEAEEAFRVGVLLGPSGSGKSSLLRAGVLPLVAEEVETVVVDAGSVNLEERLRRRLAREFLDEESEGLTMPELALRLRRRGPASGRSKMLIVIDQFEQWLSVNDGREHTPLAEALRQCDGVRLQALVVVRDDFTIPVARFLEELEEPLLQNRNFAAIDRFSPQHAAKVLESFGRAYRVWEGEPSRENRRFMELAVQELSRGGALIPVQLAALAEIVKDQPWTEGTLKQLGGVEGVAVRFLEERLVGERGHPEIRVQLPLVRRLLEAFLPSGENENIRGPAKTRSQLAAALAGEATPARLDKLVQLLDAEVRLITPVRGGAVDASDSASSQPEPAYQLTHDYLVPAIRAWLSASQRSTRSGRAHLRLKELSDAWNARPTRQRLPTFLEWLTIRTLAPPAEWSAAERRMMDAAGRRFFVRAGAVAAAVVVAAGVFWQTARYQGAKELYTSLLSADTSEVPSIVAKLSAYDRWTQRAVGLGATGSGASGADAAGEPTGPARRRRLHEQMALAARDAEAALYVAEHAAEIPPEHLAEVARLVAPQHARVMPALWEQAKRAAALPGDAALPSACLLAASDDRDLAWGELAPNIVRQLTATRPASLPHWLAHLHSQRRLLVPESLKLLEEQGNTLSAHERNLLVESIAALAADDVSALARALENAEAGDLATLWSAVEQHAAAMPAALNERIAARGQEPKSAGLALPEPPANCAASVRSYQGLMDRRWAFVTRCPADAFGQLADELKTASFAPRTLREFADDGRSFVAAVFDRSGAERKWQLGLTASAAEAALVSAENDGWVLADVARANFAGDERRYALLWEHGGLGEKFRAALNVTGEQMAALEKELEPQALYLQRCTSEVDASGRLSYCALFRSHGAANGAVSSSSRYAHAFGELYPGSCVTDLRLHVKGPDARDSYLAQSWREAYETRLGEALTAERRADLAGRAARFALLAGDHQAAARLASDLPATSTILFRRATAAARQGDVDGVKKHVAALQKAKAAAGMVLQSQLRLALLEERWDDVPDLLTRIEKADGQSNPARLAAGLALAAGHARRAESLRPREEEWRAQAMKALGDVLASGVEEMPELLAFDVDFDALRDESAFHDLVARHGLSRRYDSVWQELPDRTSKLVYDVGLAEHERLAKDLGAQGYFPVCLEAAADAASGQMHVASAWQKAVPSVAETTSAARRMARLSAAAGRLGQHDVLWDVFSDRYGHEVRAQLLDIAPGWLPAERLLEAQASAESAPVVRGFLLALGSGARPESADPMRDRVKAAIQRRMAAAGEASVVAAARWCWRRWNFDSAALAGSASSSSATGQYVNSLGQAMIIVRPPPQYLMGSPPSETDRATKPGAEQLHWQQVGRAYSIAATETTVALFKEFLEDPRVKRAYEGQPFHFTERFAPEPDCPQTSVSWFDAVRFCQWLSERERIPEADWCYPGVLEQPTGKWQFPANLLARRGYRLPSEAEWEYACRAGSTSAYPFGGDRRLLARYAWFFNTADERSHPVGSLMPNDFGLFDMLGNAQEWCHDAWHIYQSPLGGYLFKDVQADPAPMNENGLRSLRGGGFDTPARQVRSADRATTEASKYHQEFGFRVARTEAAHNE